MIVNYKQPLRDWIFPLSEERSPVLHLILTTFAGDDIQLS